MIVSFIFFICDLNRRRIYYRIGNRYKYLQHTINSWFNKSYHMHSVTLSYNTNRS